MNWGELTREDLADAIQIDAATVLDIPFREALLDVYERLPSEVQEEALLGIGIQTGRGCFKKTRRARRQ